MSNNPQYPGFQPLRPPNGGPIGSAQDFAPSMNFQFRPTILAPQSEQFVAMNSQNFQSFDRGGTAMNFGFPSQPRPPQVIASMHQFFDRPNRSSNMQQVALGPPELIAHLSGPMASRTSLSQPGVQNPVSFTPAFGGPGTLSSSFSGASVGHTMASASTMYPAFDPPLNTFVQTRPSEEALREWVEHTSVDGRRYFFNKRTKQSTWEKPFELMTQLERADATTNWKEHASPDGRKYYYNKVTKQSTWSMPEELKWARERLEKASVQGPQPETSMNASKMTSNSDLASSPASTVHSSQVSLMPSTSSSNEKHVLSSQEAASAPGSSSLIENVKEDKMITHSTSQLLDTVATANASANAMKTVSETLVDEAKISAESSDGPSADDAEQGGRSESKESQKNTVDSENIDSQLEGKRIQQELVSYTNKLEAMDAFISLLESAKVGSDWTWEQAMRVIITDRRYGALRTLGERKQAFSEFLIRKKKEEAEERQVQQNKRREEFKKMLEDCVEITPSIRWSKAVTMLEGDERFKALDREKDRRDIFEDHIDELKEKERVKALEERKRNITEYRNFLESCNFIKPNSQWRKVQDRLEADERCLRLEKIDRIEIFQEYLRDLEREEEERKKIQKEELKKAERKNRDEFRKLIDEHIEAGALTAKTSWRDYLTKVRDLPAYSAIVSNTSGATPKDLFEDAVEDLQKKHRELKSRIKDSLKRRKLTLSPASTFDEFKVSISEEISLSPVADVYLKLVFDDLLERAKEKEVKEARKRKRLAEDLVEILHSFKDITALSSWDDCKHLVEGSQECSSIGDESFRRQTFEDYVSHLKERVTEIKRREEEKEAVREEQDKQKAKHRREDSKGRHEKVSVDHGDHSLIKGHAKEHRRSGRGSSNKHREQCGDLKETETSHRKGIHKRVSGHDISRQQWPYTPEEQDGTREKRSRKENENGGKRCKKDDENGEEGNQEDEELEDGECGRY